MLEMRGRLLPGCPHRLQTDYASHESRAAFFESCKRTGSENRQAKQQEETPAAKAEAKR